MQLSLSEEQSLLAETVRRFIDEQYQFERSQAAILERRELDAGTWGQFAQQGWLALPLPEEHGGLGGSDMDLVMLMEGLGRGPVLEPYVPSAVVGGGLLAALGSEDQKATLLPAIGEGTQVAIFAHSEPSSGADLEHVAATARRDGDGWRLDGTKTLVIGAYAATWFIVSARIRGQARDRHGIGLFLVPADAGGLTQKAYASLDGALASDLQFAGVRVGADALIGRSQDALPAIEGAVDRAVVALCAQAVGSAQMLLDGTIDYTGSREQFGKALSAHQVVRHRLVDMSIACMEARGITHRAAMELDADAVSRSRAASAAKWKVAGAACFIAEQAVQLHGAIGCTEELGLGRYYRSILAFETLFGSPDQHLLRHVALRTAAPPPAVIVERVSA